MSVTLDPQKADDPLFGEAMEALATARGRVLAVLPDADVTVLDGLVEMVEREARAKIERVLGAISQLPPVTPAMLFAEGTTATPMATTTTTADLAPTADWKPTLSGDDLIAKWAWMGFTPSVYQATVFDWIDSGTGHGIVNAVAGAGKTFTLTKAANIITAMGKRALFVAFNKHTAEDLERKLAGTTMIASTMHAAGNRVLQAHVGRCKKDDWKYRLLAEAEAERALPAAKKETRNQYRRLLEKLCEYARMTLVDTNDQDAMRAMCDHFSIDIAPDLERSAFDACGRMLQAGLAQLTATSNRILDFGDMIWGPVVLGITPQERFDFVFIDECQDLNAAQTELALSLVTPGTGRVLAVGDPHQSMYGFAGADADSFDKLKSRLHAVELPLSICYRCPTSHISLAQTLVPVIQARTDAPAGELVMPGGGITEDNLRNHLREGDMILCRLTAPLIATCLKLIANRVPAKVRGREIGKQLMETVEAVTRHPFYAMNGGWSGFGETLTAWKDEQIAKLSQRRNAENQIQNLEDRVESVQLCYENYHADSPDELRRQIEGLFAGDNERAAILLSTVHRAKGLENGRVFILRHKKLPLSWPGQQEWEEQQERNIQYVAYTRATDGLFFVDEGA